MTCQSSLFPVWSILSKSKIDALTSRKQSMAACFHIQRAILNKILVCQNRYRCFHLGSRALSHRSVIMSNGLKKQLLSTDVKVKKNIKICVEGNIGSGKTSLLDYFAQSEVVEAQEEPVKKWRNIHGINSLEYMYKDPSRWGLTFQTYVQLTMLQNHLVEQKKKFRLLERSIYSAKYCFIENLYKGNLMQELEYLVLTEWFDYLIQTQNIQIDMIVYLKTTPEMCYERIKNRQRPEENLIPFDYLKSLHNLHEDWLINRKFKCPAPVVVLDGNYSKEKMEAEYNTLPHEIIRILGEAIE